MQVYLLSLEDFGLTQESLAKINKKMNIKISFCYPEVKSYIALSRPERKKKMKAHFEKILSSLTKKYTLTQMKSYPHAPQFGDTIECFVSSQDLLKLLQEKKDISSISIQKVEGMKKIKMEKSTEEIWYVVRGLFVFQIQGKTSGKATTQEEIYLVKAKSADAAVKKTIAECKKEEDPYFGGEWHILRKKFVRVTDVNSILDDDIDPKKVNFLDSNLSEIKITPEFAWK